MITLNFKEKKFRSSKTKSLFIEFVAKKLDNHCIAKVYQNSKSLGLEPRVRGLDERVVVQRLMVAYHVAARPRPAIATVRATSTILHGSVLTIIAFAVV